MGKSRTPHSHDFGIFGRAHEPQNQYYFIFGDTKILQETEDNPESVSKEYSWKSPNVKIEHFENIGKDESRKNDNPSNKLLKILNRGSISFEKHEIDFFGNQRSISS